MVKRLYKDENDRGKSLDDRHEILNVYRSQCAHCKHFKRDDYYCPAYPDGIPDELLEGDARMIKDGLIRQETPSSKMPINVFSSFHTSNYIVWQSVLPIGESA